MTNKYMERYSKKSFISVSPIKTTVKYHYIPTKMEKIQRLAILSVDKDVTQLKLSYIAGGRVRL